MKNYGTTNFKKRFDLMIERVAAIKRIWLNEKASFSGGYVNFDEIVAYPKPKSKPHPLFS